MSTPHLQPGDVGPALASQPGKAQALFKGRDLEVLRVALGEGQSLPAHAVAGEATLHGLAGRLVVQLDAGERELAAGELLYLGRAMRHEVRALTDSVVLVTLALGPAASK